MNANINQALENYIERQIAEEREKRKQFNIAGVTSFYDKK